MNPETVQNQAPGSPTRLDRLAALRGVLAAVLLLSGSFIGERGGAPAHIHHNSPAEIHEIYVAGSWFFGIGATLLLAGVTLFLVFVAVLTIQLYNTSPIQWLTIVVLTGGVLAAVGCWAGRYW